MQAWVSVHSNFLVVFCRLRAAAESNREDAMTRKLKEQLQLVGQEGAVDMVVVILPSNKKSLYDAVKKTCCIDMPGGSLFVNKMVASNGYCLLVYLFTMFYIIIFCV